MRIDLNTLLKVSCLSIVDKKIWFDEKARLWWGLVWERLFFFHHGKVVYNHLIK